MATLESRLRRLEDIDEIGRLKAAYCDACDADHDGAAIAALFLEDGTWSERDHGRHRGRDTIAAFFAGIRASRVMSRSAHLLANPAIAVDGEAATGTWRFVMLYTAREDGACHRIVGRYHDRFAREAGRWWFRSLEAVVEETRRIAAGSGSG